MRALFPTILDILAVLVYGVGLISPLTPSEGVPSFGDVLIFVILPIVLLGSSLALTRGWLARILVTIQMVAVIGFTSWLLWLQGNTSS
jgi:hypothetical protein